MPRPRGAAPALAPRHRLLAFAGSVVILIASAVASPALAASPSPPVATSDSPDAVEAWLDAEFIVPDAPPGGILEAGVTFWDTLAHDFAPIEDAYVRLLPATGTAAPSEGTITADFPGHVVADLVVPEGGPGSIEIGVHGESGDVPFQLSGTGPPPEAPPASLVTATFHRFVGDIVAGRTFPVSVDVMPRGLWDFGALTVPTELVVLARQPGGPDITTAPIVRDGQPGTPYVGHLTLPEIGDVELTVVVPGDDGADQAIAGSTTVVTVIVGGRPSSSPAASAPPSPAPASGGDVPAVVWIIGAGVLGVAGFLVLRRVLADL
jgi:hypothetical protein